MFMADLVIVAFALFSLSLFYLSTKLVERWFSFLCLVWGIMNMMMAVGASLVYTPFQAAIGVGTEGVINSTSIALQKFLVTSLYVQALFFIIFMAFSLIYIMKDSLLSVYEN